MLETPPGCDQKDLKRNTHTSYFSVLGVPDL